MNDDLRFPIGRFKAPVSVTAADREPWVAEIERLPELLRTAVDGLQEQALETPYRPDGWTLRQVIHHIPDSHMNAYVRFRLALTEESPRIKPYQEARWAELSDARGAPIDASLALTSALHQRWVALLRSMDESDWQRSYDHPEGGPFPLTRALALYAWHGRHHVGHITGLREREGW